MKEILKPLYCGLAAIMLCNMPVLGIIAAVFIFKDMLSAIGILAVLYFIVFICLVLASLLFILVIGLLVEDSFNEIKNQEVPNENTNA